MSTDNFPRAKLEDDSKIAEWVGLHYLKHWPSLSAEDQQVWRDRYHEQHNTSAPAEPLESQVQRLSTFIMENVPGEPSQSEGAIDCAIRVLSRHYTEGGAHVADVWHQGTKKFYRALLLTEITPADALAHPYDEIGPVVPRGGAL